MIEHVNEWLSAYLDGELHGFRLHQVESHLADCAACRADLESLRGLSSLLHETPPTRDFIPSTRFASNLALRLGSQETLPENSSTRKFLQLAWALIPAGVLGAWVFLQIVFNLSPVLLYAKNSGLFGESLSWIQNTQPQTEWYATTLSLFGDQLGGTEIFTLSALNNTEVFFAGLIGHYTLLFILAVLYWGWLFIWWFRHRGGTSGSRVR